MKEIVTAKEFNKVATQDKPVLLDFYADWCGPCKALLPTVEKLAVKYEGAILIRKVNVDRFPALAQKFGVRSLPALFLIQDKKVLEKLQGNQSQPALESFIARNTEVVPA
ncbi:MAG: thioredoxin 1 [Saprospiraceae bacterium]|jgi:thioredoxin 1|tara:strand:+ start:866 stop:1195 length:330 start_codon:yes stop_codon:yes gene_type:complete